jgi:Flp pilus assembly protein TadD
MLIKFFKLFCFILLLIYQSSVYSKNKDINEFNSKNFSSYFSALVSYDNQKNTDALKFFNLSDSLINKHDPYLKKYVFSLVLEGKIKQSIKQLKKSSGKKSSDFFEAYLILTLDSIKKKNFKKSNRYLNELSRFKENSTFELIIYESLKNYIYLFENKQTLLNNNTLGNLSLVSKIFHSCYIGEKATQAHFENLVNSDEVNYSRYIFFYINYLIEQNQFNKAKEITDQIDILNSSLLIAQTKNWIDKKEFKKFNQIFSCKNETDVLSEFLFLIASIYSSENEIEKSNFYLNISRFLNPKFNFNLSLFVENYYNSKNYRKSEKVLSNFDKNDDLYYWYKIKIKKQIILKELGQDEAYNFINLKFKKIKKPSIKILFDMGNIMKVFEKHQIAINYYDEILSKINENSDIYAEILYRRGGSYERLKKFKKSDEDLLKSLEINPNDAYVLNYLAYSWLERNYKIDTAIEMLQKAYQKENNDPFIIDSVGWGYYLVNDLVKAESFLRRAIELMPNDPIVNDHYGDVLWKMDRKIQAKYYWQSILKFEDTEESMKEKIKIKLLKGLKKI